MPVGQISSQLLGATRVGGLGVVAFALACWKASSVWALELVPFEGRLLHLRMPFVARRRSRTLQALELVQHLLLECN